MSAGLVIGAGCSRGCPAAELAELVEETLAGLEGTPIALATIDSRAAEPCMVGVAARCGVALHTHPAAALAAVEVPSPSAVVAVHVGTASVAEAAALLSAGPHGLLVVAKRRSAHATCAVAQEHA
ncbi:MAG: cobalamin biosynthesis protein [Thermoleophilaceae bacterium]